LPARWTFKYARNRALLYACLDESKEACTRLLKIGRHSKKQNLKGIIVIEKTVAEIEDAIREKNYYGAIGLLRAWLEICEQGEPNKLLAACAPSIRMNVREMLCDVLSCYPQTILGFPLLIFGAAKSVDDGFLTLPFPTFENANPCPGLRFLGWVPCDTSLPIRLPFLQKQYRTEVKRRKPIAYRGVSCHFGRA